MSGDERRTMDVAEAAEALGVSKVCLYEAIRRGEIKAIRVGRRVLVARATLERILQGDEWPESPAPEKRR